MGRGAIFGKRRCKRGYGHQYNTQCHCKQGYRGNPYHKCEKQSGVGVVGPGNGDDDLCESGSVSYVDVSAGLPPPFRYNYSVNHRGGGFQPPLNSGCKRVPKQICQYVTKKKEKCEVTWSECEAILFSN